MLVAISSPVMFSKNVFFVFFCAKFCAKSEVVNKNNLGQSLRVRRFNRIWCGSKMAASQQQTRAHEKICCVTSCGFHEKRATKLKFVAQSRPALYFSQQLSSTRNKCFCFATSWLRKVRNAKHQPKACNETMLRHKLRVFVSCISPPLVVFLVLVQLRILGSVGDYVNANLIARVAVNPCLT